LPFAVNVTLNLYYKPVVYFESSFLPSSIPEGEKRYHPPFEDFVGENATLSNMLDVVVAKNCRPHLPNNSNDHEVS